MAFVLGYLYPIKEGIRFIMDKLNAETDLHIVDKVQMRNTLRQMDEFVDLVIKEHRNRE